MKYNIVLINHTFRIMSKLLVPTFDWYPGVTAQNTFASERNINFMIGVAKRIFAPGPSDADTYLAEQIKQLIENTPYAEQNSSIRSISTSEEQKLHLANYKLLKENYAFLKSTTTSIETAQMGPAQNEMEREFYSSGGGVPFAKWTRPVDRDYFSMKWPQLSFGNRIRRNHDNLAVDGLSRGRELHTRHVKYDMGEFKKERNRL